MAAPYIILLAHGSRDPQWKVPFERLHEQLSARHENVALAYWELTEPSLEQIVASVQAQGVTHCKVLPLFFSQGKHLREDLPAQIESLEQRHGLTLELLPPVGEHPSFAGFMELLISELISKEVAVP
ncbi:MAG: cobalamin biosynthesis protein CbiX [Gammaproteobacteria bacterium]|nr:MAG: cobalamin biosynthesis protein CbiX [Gammaproteobacteria bacterium]